jgi:hypothetical protein
MNCNVLQRVKLTRCLITMSRRHLRQWRSVTLQCQMEVTCQVQILPLNHQGNSTKKYALDSRLSEPYSHSGEKKNLCTSHGSKLYSLVVQPTT